MLHHIAIGSPQILKIADFYLKLPRAQKMKEWQEEDGTLRSVWIQMDGFVLMIEKGRPMGPKALVFGFQKQDEDAWKTLLGDVKITNRTEYTVYFEDPDGNKVGVSQYPIPLPW